MREENENAPGANPENQLTTAERDSKAGAVAPVTTNSSSTLTVSAALQRRLGPIADQFELYLDQHGVAQLEQKDVALAHRVGSNSSDHLLRMALMEQGQTVSDFELAAFNKSLIACAEHAGALRPVWLRVAPYDDGAEIDRGDRVNTRFRVTPGKVEIISSGSTTVFRRPTYMRALPMPAEQGDWGLLYGFVNVDRGQFTLLLGYLTYTLVHAKQSGTTFPILQIISGEGSGKSMLTKIVMMLLDPSVIGPQTLPRSERDLAIAVKDAHALAFDNLRWFSHSMADALCRIATGGAFATRRLYSDGEQVVHHLHGALILNGIHAFVDQPDLAQRCLPFILQPLDDADRRDEVVMLAELDNDLPVIFRGLLDLAAEILLRLPEAQVVRPERVIAFSKWLAALELVHGAPLGVYQDAYSDALNTGMLDALLENSLASAVLTFARNLRDGRWSGTPRALYQELCDMATHRTVYARDWPRSEIAMAKQLRALQAGLARQDVEISFNRGRERSVTIVRAEGHSHD